MVVAERRRQHGNGGGSIGSAVAASAEWRRQRGSKAATAIAATMAATMMAVAGMKTMVETAIVGDTVDNQLKGVVEEMTAAAMVMAAEIATATKTVMILAMGGSLSPIKGRICIKMQWLRALRKREGEDTEWWQR
jgi:hypothetical protein